MPRNAPTAAATAPPRRGGSGRGSLRRRRSSGGDATHIARVRVRSFTSGARLPEPLPRYVRVAVLLLPIVQRALLPLDRRQRVSQATNAAAAATAADDGAAERSRCRSGSGGCGGWGPHCPSAYQRSCPLRQGGCCPSIVHYKLAPYLRQGG